MHQNNHNRKLTIRVIPIAVAAAFSGGVLAQQAIEEVVVTAQKRVQKLQDVPISITAISGRELEDKKIDGFGSLDGIAPNVTLRSAPAAPLTAAVYIRGVGTGQPAMWTDPSVGLYVDGVFVGKNQGAMFDLLDLERVEVLRGPQGTLFGRNTEGGAINFVSRPPSGEFSGVAGVEFGNYGLKSQRVAMDLPAMGPLKVNFAIRNSDQDGWMPKPNGKDWGSDNRTSARFGALLEINPRLKVSYAFDSSHISGTPTAIAVVNNTGYNTRYPGLSPALPTGAALFTPAGAGARFSAQNICTRGYSGLYNYAVSQVGAAGAGALFKGAFGSALGGMIANGCCGPVQGMLGNASGTSVPGSVPGLPGKSYWQHLDTEGHAINAAFNVNDQNTVKYIGSVRKMHMNQNRDLAGSAQPVFEQNYNQNYKCRGRTNSSGSAIPSA